MDQYPNQGQESAQQQQQQYEYKGYAPIPNDPYSGYQPPSNPYASHQQPDQPPNNPYASYQQPTQQPLYQSPSPRKQKSNRLPMITLAGSLLALLGFLLPYFASYSGYYLAGDYGLYWFDPLFAIAAIILLAVVVIGGKRQWALGLIGIGIGAAFLHYLIVGMDSSPEFWGFGAWLYSIGMIVVAIGGIPLLFLRKR